jgi:uncharacterized membrane protein
MKIAWILLGLLLAICLVIVITLLIPETPDKQAFTHPEYKTMLQSPDGMKRHGHILWLGWSFGILQFCFFTCLLALCLNKQGRLKIFKTPLLVGMSLCIAALGLMMAAYWAYIRDGSASLFGSFPLPTALMLYALWPMQIIFVIIFVWYYDRGIFTAEDEERFRAIVKSRREQMEGPN